jgi:hypothetical protein
MRMRGDFWLATPVREDDPARAALRSAMTILIEAVGGAAAADVRVARINLSNGLLYAALVPVEYRADVLHYLAERTDLSMPLDGYALILNSDQALEVIGVAKRTARQWRTTPLGLTRFL